MPGIELHRQRADVDAARPAPGVNRRRARHVLRLLGNVARLRGGIRSRQQAAQVGRRTHHAHPAGLGQLDQRPGAVPRQAVVVGQQHHVETSILNAAPLPAVGAHPQAERAHAALALQLQNRVRRPAGPQNRLQVPLRLRVVNEDDVQMLLPQRLPALLQGGAHGGAVVAPLHAGTGPDLGGDAEAGPLGSAQLAQGYSQAALGHSALIQRGGVDVVDAQLQSLAHRAGGDRAALRRSGVPLPYQTQRCPAEPQHGQLQVEPPEAPARQPPGGRRCRFCSGILSHACTVAHAPWCGRG